jgi:hypothetical protein
MLILGFRELPPPILVLGFLFRPSKETLILALRAGGLITGDV